MDDLLGAVERALGHRFSDRSLLELALTHASFDTEQARPTGTNGRLEFLGDVVLGLIVSTDLYNRWDMAEGEMTKTRASVVNESALAAVGMTLGIPAAVRLGRGEDAGGGRAKPAIVADTVEAVIAAVYLDAGFEVAQRVVLDLWRPLIEANAITPGETDHKSILQEILASRGLVLEYRTTGSGPDHERMFDTVVMIEGEVAGRGTGTSKKRAEAIAAREALATLGLDNA